LAQADPVFFLLACRTRPVFFTYVLCRDNDFNVSINHDQAEARFMTAPRSYSV